MKLFLILKHKDWFLNTLFLNISIQVKLIMLKNTYTNSSKYALSAPSAHSFLHLWWQIFMEWFLDTYHYGQEGGCQQKWFYFYGPHDFRSKLKESSTFAGFDQFEWYHWYDNILFNIQHNLSLSLLWRSHKHIWNQNNIVILKYSILFCRIKARLLKVQPYYWWLFIIFKHWENVDQYFC